MVRRLLLAGTAGSFRQMSNRTPGDNPPSFQDLILNLQRYWADQGCVILQPYDMEMGAGTFHPATVLRALGPEPWHAAYVQPSRRPTPALERSLSCEKYPVLCRISVPSNHKQIDSTFPPLTP